LTVEPSSDNSQMIFYFLILIGFVMGFAAAIFFEESRPGEKVELVASKNLEERIRSLEHCRDTQMKQLAERVEALENK
jgi:hypothetical protein